MPLPAAQQVPELEAAIGGCRERGALRSREVGEMVINAKAYFTLQNRSFGVSVAPENVYAALQTTE